MKTTELQILWKLVKDGEDRTLTAADLRLLMRIRFALQENEAQSCRWGIAKRGLQKQGLLT